MVDSDSTNRLKTQQELLSEGLNIPWPYLFTNSQKYNIRFQEGGTLGKNNLKCRYKTNITYWAYR